MSLMRTLFPVLFTGFLVLAMSTSRSHAGDCKPTEPDMLGPFYEPNAPVRSSVGKGYVLQGTVKSSKGCGPIRDAVVEFWLAGPDGTYDDAHRATIFSDAAGLFRFESSVPVPYAGRPPHIHIRVSAKGFRTLVTQHYAEPGKTNALFDLVLMLSD